jgi:hypothetical protein
MVVGNIVVGKVVGPSVVARSNVGEKTAPVPLGECEGGLEGTTGALVVGNIVVGKDVGASVVAMSNVGENTAPAKLGEWEGGFVGTTGASVLGNIVVGKIVGAKLVVSPSRMGESDGNVEGTLVELSDGESVGAAEGTATLVPQPNTQSRDGDVKKSPVPSPP